MEHCDVCDHAKDTPDLASTYVLTQQDHTKHIRICRTCVIHICDDTQIGEWFPLKSTDEIVRLPNSFYMKL